MGVNNLRLNEVIMGLREFITRSRVEREELSQIRVIVQCPHCGQKLNTGKSKWEIKNATDLLWPAVPARCLSCDKDFQYRLDMKSDRVVSMKLR